MYLFAIIPNFHVITRHFFKKFFWAKFLALVWIKSWLRHCHGGWFHSGPQELDLPKLLYSSNDCSWRHILEWIHILSPTRPGSIGILHHGGPTRLRRVRKIATCPLTSGSVNITTTYASPWLCYSEHLRYLACYLEDKIGHTQSRTINHIYNYQTMCI